MAILGFILFLVIGSVILLEVVNRKRARDELSILMARGFAADTICHFGEYKIAFDSANKRIAFINVDFLVRDDAIDGAMKRRRLTTIDDYSNMKQLLVRRSLSSNSMPHGDLRFSFHSPTYWGAGSSTELPTAGFPKQEIDKLMQAWPAALETSYQDRPPFA
jgi:hypothetical protein